MVKFDYEVRYTIYSYSHEFTRIHCRDRCRCSQGKTKYRRVRGEVVVASVCRLVGLGQHYIRDRRHVPAMSFLSHCKMNVIFASIWVVPGVRDLA